MRRALISIAAVTAGCSLVLAACGDDDPPPDTPPASPSPAGTPPTVAPPPETGPPDQGWDGNAQVDFETGELRAEGFNDLIEAEAPQWAQEPVETASVLLHLDRETGTVDIEEESENGDPAVVVTISDLADDSVAAIRYRIVLSPGPDGLHRLSSGEASWRCRPDRGHQDFDTGPCI